MTACHTPGVPIEYVLQIDQPSPLSQMEKEKLKGEILTRLDKFGFSDSQVLINDDKLVVVSTVNIEDEAEIAEFRALFGSNKLDLWDTFSITDPMMESIDSAALEVDGFQPYYTLDRNFFTRAALGVCKDTTKLEKVKTQLSSNTKSIDGLKLIWSEATAFPLNSSKQVYFLYMIDTKGKTEAPITEKDFVKVSGMENTFLPGTYQVYIKMNKAATTKWAEMTERAAFNNNRSVALVYNDRVLSAPSVMSPILSGGTALSNDYSKEQTIEIARKLTIGRMDYTLIPLREQIIEQESN